MHSYILNKYTIKSRVSNLEKPTRVSFLKLSNQKNPTPPFRPPPMPLLTKHVTSLLALAIGLPSLVEDSGHAQWVHVCVRK